MMDRAQPYSRWRDVESVYKFFEAFPRDIAAAHPHRQHCLHPIPTPLIALCHVRLHEMLSASVPDCLAMGNGPDGDWNGPKVTEVRQGCWRAVRPADCACP